MRWDMTVLRESPWYQEILQRGKREERLSNIESYLKVKFGDEGLQLMPKISQTSDFEQLGKIYLSIIAVENLEELRLVVENLS
jgi:predicted transposase YdaD